MIRHITYLRILLCILFALCFTNTVLSAQELSNKKEDNKLLRPGLYDYEWREIVFEIEELKVRDSLKSSIIKTQSSIIDVLKKTIEIDSITKIQYATLYEIEKESNQKLTEHLKKNVNEHSFFTRLFDNISIFMCGFGAGIVIAVIVL